MELVNKGILDKKAECEACTYHLWKRRPVIQSCQLRVVLFKWQQNSSPFRVCKFRNRTGRTTAHCPPCRLCFCEIDENPHSASNCPHVGCALVVAWCLALNTVWGWTPHSGRCGFKSWVIIAAVMSVIYLLSVHWFSCLRNGLLLGLNDRSCLKPLVWIGTK